MRMKTQPGLPPRPPREFSLAALAEQSGVPERTIRYYIARGLLAPPGRGGRGAFYTTDHLDRLQEIQRRQHEGLTLAEIGRVESAGAAACIPEPEPWLQYTLAPDVVVQVRTGTSPWRVRQIKSALNRLARELA